MKLIKIKCENCGSMLEFNEDLDKISCNYCGAVNIIDDEATKIKRIEEAKLKARKDNHEQDLKEKEDMLNQEIELQKKKEEIDSKDKFKKGKWPKRIIIMIVICAIFTYLSFTSGKMLTGIIGIVQIASFVVGYLLGMNIIKEKFKSMHSLFIVLGFILIIPFLSTYGNSGSSFTNRNCKSIDWDDIHYNELLVKKDDIDGEIISNGSYGVYIKLCNISKNDYKKYKEDIVKKGYEYDSDYDEKRYNAYNLDGYHIDLSYDERDKKLSIDLDVPDKIGEFTWPISGVATTIPKTKSKNGNIYKSESDSFIISVYKTTKLDFNNYVDECKKVGYDIDYNKRDTFYSAKNESGNVLNITYVEGNIIRIELKTANQILIDKQKEEEKQNNNSNSNNNSNNNNNQTKIRNDFKNAMDSYEAFIDEYIKFMKKYNSTGDASLLKDYLDYLNKYQEFSDNFEKWKSDNLSDEETKYYLEVQTRVSKKLIDAAV